MRFNSARINQNLFDTKIGERRLISIRFFIQRNTDLINDLVVALLLDRRTNQTRLISVDIVLSKYFLYRFNPCLNRGLIVGRTILSQ